MLGRSFFIWMAILCGSTLTAQVNKKNASRTYPDYIAPVGIIKGLTDEQQLDVVQKQTFGSSGTVLTR